MQLRRIFTRPTRDYCIVIAIAISLAVEFIMPSIRTPLWIIAIIGSLPTLISALLAISKRRITIDVFNLFSLAVAFALGELRSAGFIILMLECAEILDFHTETRAKRAVERLFALKPQTALVEYNNNVREIKVEDVKAGDILVISAGGLIPVDGVIVFGTSYINEASVTGESEPVEKIVGDHVLSSTLNESGVIKIKATRVGADSTIERMGALIKESMQNKSRPEKLADHFAAIFLPIVILIALIVYFTTKNIVMTAAIFLVACADDMAIALPLAITAAMGRAAKRGVIVKGGVFLHALAKLKTLVLDKTGTLTYGHFALKELQLEKNIDEKKFWLLVGAAQKFSEHPVGRAIFREARKRVQSLPDPDQITAVKSKGVHARVGKDDVIIGSEKFFRESGILIPDNAKKALDEIIQTATPSLVAFNEKYAGLIAISDVPKPEAKESLLKMKKIGIDRIVMFTGDKKTSAKYVAGELGITEIKAEMTPEEKVKELEKIIGGAGTVAMVGDGVNDAPALARADVGIAMGNAGTAVAVEAADVVIIGDRLSKIPEMVELSRRTQSVITTDIVIWFISNLVGFTLVLTGVAGLVLAAFYNFATDFLPIINSARLFKKMRN